MVKKSTVYVEKEVREAYWGKYRVYTVYRKKKGGNPLYSFCSTAGFLFGGLPKDKRTAITISYRVAGKK